MKRKILVVDDSSADLYMMETLLKGYGYDVTTAENGEQALEKARLNPPDLVISDSLMPVMDGYSLCRVWKADDTLRHRPFVLYTATYTDPRDEIFALDLGVDRFIPKPQEPDVLAGIVRELLEDGYRARQVEAKPLEEEMQFFRQYNEILFQKLEQKMADLETANRDLRLSEESYRRTFLNASDVIYTVDNDFILRSISPSVERILGYKEQDFVDRPVTEFGRLVLTPESFERAIADVAVILGGQRIASTVYEFIAKDGTLIYGEVSGSPLKQDGKVTGIVSVARDITDRMLTERALRENEEKYRSLFDHCPDAVYALDAEGGFLSVNESTCRITGYSREELLRMKFDPLIVPDDKQRVRSHFQKALHGEPQNYETTVLHKDGDQRIIQVTNTPVTVEGKIVGVYAIAEDITERVRAERALRENEEKYRSMFDHSMDAIFLTRPDGTILDANPAACMMFGRPREEIVRIGRNGLVDPMDPRLHAALKNRAAQGAAMAEFTMIRANGEKFPVEMTSSIFMDESGLQKTIVIVRDITERERSAEALKERDARYKKLFSEVPGMIYQFLRRPDGTYCVPYTTDAIKNIFGCLPQDVLEDFSPFEKVILPDDLQEVIRSIESSAEQMSIWRCEFRVRIPGQPIRWILGHSTPERLADGGTLWHGFITDVTERRRQEEELRRSEADFQDLFNEAPVGYFEYDGRGYIHRTNRTFLEMLGYQPGEMVGQPAWEFIQDEKARQQILDKLAGTLAPFNGVERLYRRKDGSLLPVLVQDRLFCDEQGRIQGIRCTAQDIAERKRAADALAEREKKFRFIAEKMTDIVYMQDMNLRTLYVSPSIEAVLGFTPEERMAQDVLQQLTPESMSVALDVMAKELALEQQGQADPDRKITLELEFCHKDGSTRWMENIISGIRNDRGALIGLHGVCRDVTQRKKAEEALESERRLLQSVINNIPDRIYAKDAESRFILCNEALIRRMGRTRMDEILGKTDFDFLPREVAQRFYEDEQEILQSGKPMINREEPLATEDGKITRWNLATKVPLLDREGNRIGIVGVGREITDLKQAQENLQTAREQLLQAERLASIGRLSAGVAHEILNPVNIISLELQLLRAKGDLPLDVLKELKICMAQIERIVRITKDLKQLSRFPSGKTVMADINDTIAHIMNMYATQLKIEKIEAKMQFQPDLPMISMDKGKIEQVILNLVTNAADAMEGKEKKVLRIRTERERTGGSDFLKITVADNGKGISNENLAKIYDPFFTTKEPGKGTGLGLSISYGIVQEHGGMVWAANNEWGGASFYVRLPVKTDV